MDLNRPAVNEVAGRRHNDIELEVGSADVYGDVQSELDGHTHKYAVATAHETDILCAKDSTTKSEPVLSVRMIVVAAVSVLILSTLASTIVVVVYHTTIAKLHEETSSRRLDLVEVKQDTLEQTHVNTSLQLDTLEQTQVNTSLQLDTLEQTQVNTSLQLDTLEQTQVNTSLQLDTLEQTQAKTMETLTEEHTTTNRQLAILAEKQNISGQHVAFSVYGLRPILRSDNIPLFYSTVINTGHYSMTSGRFTCPLAGVYYFSFSFEHNSGDSGVAYCYFKVNGSGWVYVAVRQGPYESASGSVIQHLSVYDNVGLYCHTGWQYVLTGKYNAVFSGFLITPD